MNMTTATQEGTPKSTPEATTAAIAGSNTRRTSRGRAFRVLLSVGIALAIVGAVLIGVGTYTRDQIRDQLVAQQIVFPPADSFPMPAADYPGLQQYAGQLVDDGPKAKAWANEFMTPHILELSDGVPYGVFGAIANADPEENEADAISRQMGLGEAQRGLLLSAWGWWTIGNTMVIAGTALLVIGGISLLVAAFLWFRASQARRTGAQPAAVALA